MTNCWTAGRELQNGAEDWTTSSTLSRDPNTRNTEKTSLNLLTHLTLTPNFTSKKAFSGRIMGAAVVLRNQAREVFPRCCTQMLLRIILLVVLIRGEALDWRSIANGAKNFGKSLKDKATSLFEGEDAVVSDEENHCCLLYTSDSADE